MPQYFGAAADLKDKRLRDFLDTAGFHLHALKKKQILEAEIRRTAREIEYIEDKIAVAGKQLQETVEANEEIEPRLQGAERKLSRFQKERGAAESEYETLKAIEEDVKGKRAILPGIKKQIAHLRGDVSKLSARFKALHPTYQESLVKKENLEKETGGLKTRSSGLENEIPVMRNTKDILVGLMPEGFDPDTFHAIQDHGEIEKAINGYVAEVNKQIERLEKETSELDTQLDGKRTQAKPLLSKKEHLEGKVKDLTADVGGEVEKATIVDEIDRLRAEKERFAAESERMMKEMNRLDSSTKSLDHELEQGKKLERDLMERYTYLISRKQEMSEFDNIEAEIERIQNEVQKHDRGSNVNDRLIEITNEIKQDVGLINGKLRSVIKEHDKQFDVFVNIVHPK